MKISIITPTYNRAFCIGRVITSVKNLSVPEGFTYEHVVIDDGSTDRTSAAVKKLQHPLLKYRRLKRNKGVNGARNAGVKKARGDYVLFLDSDDELVPEALVIIKHVLEQTKRKFKVYNFQTRHARTGKLMSHVGTPDTVLPYQDRLAGTTVRGEFISLVDKKVFKKLKFDEDRVAFESFFWNKLAKRYKADYFSSKAIRIYHDDDTGRLSKRLLAHSLVKRRLVDYEHYLATFRKDYLKYRLNTPLAHAVFMCGFYQMLAGEEKKKARAYFREARSLAPRPAYFVALFLSVFGAWPFRMAQAFFRLHS